MEPSRAVELLQVSVQLDPWLSLPALVAYSGLSRRTLGRHLATIPHYRVGDKPLVRRSDFDAWMEQWRRDDAAAEARIQRVRRGLRNHLTGHGNGRTLPP